MQWDKVVILVVVLTELRNHPRFAARMEEVGLMDYWRETGLPDLCQRSTHEPRCD